MEEERNYWQSDHQGLAIHKKEVLNEYLLSLKLERKAEATISKYKFVLERFLCDCSIPLGEMTSEDVLAWLTEFSKDKKAKSVDLYLSTLSSFFKFCLEEEYLGRMLIKKRWRPKIPQALPKFLNEKEFAQVKLNMETLSLRDRALVLFLFTSGCRKSEVIQLTIDDIDLAKRNAKVKGKGNKIRYVHFSEECALVLKDYLRTRSYKPSDPLFLNKFGQGLKSTGVYGVTKKLGETTGLRQNLFPHCCRHTFATNMLSKGADLQFIADEMGHSDMNTTRIYARIPSEDLMLAYQNKMG